MTWIRSDKRRGSAGSTMNGDQVGSTLIDWVSIRDARRGVSNGITGEDGSSTGVGGIASCSTRVLSTAASGSGTFPAIVGAWWSPLVNSSTFILLLDGYALVCIY